MTMATINVLMGIVGIFFTVGVALGALVYLRDGLRTQGIRRRLHFLSAAILGVLAWGAYTTVGQDFARASDARLLSEPADAVGLGAVVFLALVAIAILAANAMYWRRALRAYLQQ